MTQPQQSQFDAERSISDHLTIWHNILSVCLGWSKEETLAWATSAGWLDRLKNPSDWIYHDPPQFCLVGVLTPATLSHLEGEEWMTYIQKIQAAVGSWDEPQLAGTHYRIRVAAVLAEYGTSLPE